MSAVSISTLKQEVKDLQEAIPNLETQSNTILSPERIAENISFSDAEPFSTEGLENRIQEIGQTGYLMSLPKEMLFIIISNLLPSNVGILARVSKNWKNLCDDYRYTLQRRHIDRIAKGQYTTNLLLGHGEKVDCLFEKEHVLYSGSIYNIKIWDMKTGQYTSTLWEEDKVNSLQIHGNFLYSCTWKTIKIRDLATMQCCAKLEGEHQKSSFYCILVEKDVIYTGTLDGKILIWDVKTQRCVSTLHNDGGIRCLYKEKDFLYVGVSGKIVIWDVSTRKCISAWQAHENDVYCLSKKGDVLYSSAFDCKIKIWNAATGKCTTTLEGHTGPVFQFFIDGYFLYSSSFDDTIKIWDLTTGECVATLQGDQKGILCMHKDEDILYSGGWDKSIKVWNFTASKSS
ncbi:MAG TPA: F-box protein [Rhabdochlamydiaceae bacterium]|nr:F-box protein [Rhabdochlamydiaceae bacterium]